MCEECARNSEEYRDRLREHFNDERETILTKTTRQFSKFLQAMEDHDDFEVAQRAADLQGAFGSIAKTLYLANADEFMLKSAKEYVAKHEKED